MAATDKFDIFLLDDDRDVLLIRQGYCNCVIEKLNPIRVWLGWERKANRSDIEYLREYGTRIINKIRCNCSNKRT